MKTVWINHLKGEDQENFRKFILSSRPVLDKLKDIVYNKVKDAQKVRSSDYADASWAYKQAHLNGRVDALNEILDLLDLKEQ